LQDQLDRAIKGGAKVVAGGERDGNFFSPMVLTDVTPGNDAYREELFGPVAVVYRVGSEEEAVKLANDTPFGLGSYLFTTDPEQAGPRGQRDRGRAWSTSTSSAPTVPSCHSAASSGPAGGASSASTGGRVRQQEADPGRLTDPGGRWLGG
jgi:acyl-CoA reductase-like NAD-dependent aldehyde dehydrogenase